MPLKKKKKSLPTKRLAPAVTRESTRHEFVLFYDICRRLIFSANRLSASKWSSRRNEEGCRARGVARGETDGYWRGMEGNETEEIDEDRRRERERYMGRCRVFAYIYAYAREKRKGRREGRAKGEGRHISQASICPPLFIFHDGWTPAMRSDVGAYIRMWISP